MKFVFKATQIPLEMVLQLMYWCADYQPELKGTNQEQKNLAVKYQLKNIEH